MSHKKNIEHLNSKMHRLLQHADSHKELTRPKTGDEAWIRLEGGNKRFLTGDLVSFMHNLAAEINPEFRASLAAGQHPFATILTCSDSRVAPELLFDEGLGQLFIVRIAGNRLGTIDLASIEYGVGHLNTPLLLVMGHESCGAVIAAFDLKEGDKPEGHLSAILNKITPIAKEVKATINYESSKNDAIAAGVQKNVTFAKNEVMSSTVVQKLVSEGKLKVVTAVYHLSGEVKVFT